METKHRDALRKHRMTLCSGFSEKCEDVLESLVKLKTFNVVDKEIIMSQEKLLMRCEKILDLLPKRGPRAFETFVKILSDQSFHHLVALLTDQPLNEKDLAVEHSFDGKPPMEEADSFDGRPPVHEQNSGETNSLCPDPKQRKLDEPSADDLDSTDTPQVAKTEEEDGRFQFGSKKKEKTDEVDLPAESVNPNDCYAMSYVPRGKFLLINNKDFLPESGMAPYTRNGTDVDAAAMRDLFEELGFIVEEHRNITVYEIRKVFKKAATSDYSKMSAFAACVLSHGQEGIIYGIDGTIDIKELTGYFRGQNLAGKPKMFFFQACQGSEYMDAVDQIVGDEIDGPPEYGNDISLPTESDFLYAYSTVPGYYSWRNSTKGSWFIQAIVDVFRKHAHKMDVVRMLTRVNQIVATKKSQTGQRQSHHKRQISSIITQLRKEIYLCPPNGPLKRCTSIDY